MLEVEGAPGPVRKSSGTRPTCDRHAYRLRQRHEIDLRAPLHPAPTYRPSRQQELRAAPGQKVRPEPPDEDLAETFARG